MERQRQLELPVRPTVQLSLELWPTRWQVVTSSPPWPWIKIDDGLPGHPKWRRLSSSARCLWIEALCWSGQHLTDGHLPLESTAGLAFAAALRDGVDWSTLVDELVDAGLWEVDSDGWRIHDYLEYQPSRDDVADARARTRERVAAWRARQRDQSQQTRNVTNAVSNSVTPPPCNAVRTRAPGPGPDPFLFPSPPPSAAAAARARDGDERESFGRYLEAIWDAYRGRLPHDRKPSEREQEVVERWHRVGVDADFAVEVLGNEPTVTRTLIWFADKMLEAWEGHLIQIGRADLLRRLELLYGRLGPDAATDLAQRIEGADSSDELREVEAAIVATEGSS